VAHPGLDLLLLRAVAAAVAVTCNRLRAPYVVGLVLAGLVQGLTLRPLLRGVGLDAGPELRV